MLKVIKTCLAEKFSQTIEKSFYDVFFLFRTETRNAIIMYFNTTLQGKNNNQRMLCFYFNTKTRQTSKNINKQLT